MIELHNFRIDPLVRLIWNTKKAKEHWEKKISKVQGLVKNAMLKAYEKDILNVYSYWKSYDDEDSNDILGKSIFKIPAGTSPNIRTKAYTWFNNDQGYFNVYAKKNANLLKEEVLNEYDLFLTSGYSNSNKENIDWYERMVLDGVYDPINEMENKDSMNYLLNPFFRHIGIYILPYIPFSWNDRYSLELAKEILKIMKSIDLETTKDLISILKLPVRRDTWRGVAIVDTPIFKTITDSVPYKYKQMDDYEIEEMKNSINRKAIIGTSYGTNFPYISKRYEKLSTRNG